MPDHYEASHCLVRTLSVIERSFPLIGLSVGRELRLGCLIFSVVCGSIFGLPISTTIYVMTGI